MYCMVSVNLYIATDISTSIRGSTNVRRLLLSCERLQRDLIVEEMSKWWEEVGFIEGSNETQKLEIWSLQFSPGS